MFMVGRDPLVAFLIPVLTCAATVPTVAAVEAGVRLPAPQQEQDPITAQRNRFLVEKYLEDAARLRAEGRNDEARALLLRARDLMPGDQRVQTALASLAAETGDRTGTAQTYAEQMRRLYEIREQRAIADVQAMLEAGQRAAANRDYDAAIQSYRRAMMQIEVGRDISWGELAQRTRALLAEAEDQRDSRLREEQQVVERETLRRLREAEETELAQRRARVDGYMATAIRAFQSGRFQLAQDLAYRALALEPTNEDARNLHNAATKALRDTSRDQYYQRKRDEFRRMMEANEELRTPYTDVLRVDATIWDKAQVRAAGTRVEVTESPDNAAVRQAIRTTMVPPRRFTEENGTFEEVKALLSTLTGIPIIITPEARAAIAEESLTVNMDLVAELSVENFLTQMVNLSPNLAWTVRNGVVEITTKSLAGGDKNLRTHDIRDLKFPLTNFTPPTIKDLPSGDAVAPRTGGEEDDKVAYIEDDALLLQIREATGPENWEGDGAGTLEIDGGYLLVNANPKMQQAVEKFLDDQRRFATAVVTVESKFLTVAQNFLQQIGVDFRGLGGSGNKGSNATLDDITNKLDDNASRGLDNGGTGEDAGHPTSGAFFNDGGDGDVRARTENFFGSGALGRALSPIGGATAAISILDDLEVQMIIRAVEKRQNIDVVNSQIITVLNNTRANVAVINQTSYVRDFDVEVAQASFIADPKVDVIQDGIVLDVRPVISYDRKHIKMNLQPTVAELQRPIPTFTTSLAGSTLPVTLQLPVLTVKSFSTTAEIPDGGSVLIGGLREVLSRERRAEVPILGSIPLISFFFKQEGVADENSSLMVLVRATITDVRDVTDNR